MENVKVELIRDILEQLKKGKRVQLEYQPSKRVLKVLTVTSKKIEEVEL